MSAETERDAVRLKKRFQELSQKSFAQDTFLFTDFLTLAEQALFWECPVEVRQGGYALSGGIEGAERVMIRFGSPERLGYEQEFPIQCLEIRPLQKKFAEDLTHRDFLGALMNLGIERSTLGDIVLEKGSGYLFCMEHISTFLTENLNRIRHTNVECVLLTEVPPVLKKEPEQQEFAVASERIDAVVSRLYNIARSSGNELFAKDKVWVNGRQAQKSSLILKEGDVISVRGYGKFVYYGQRRETKKGRIFVSVGVYR